MGRGRRGVSGSGLVLVSRDDWNRCRTCNRAFASRAGLNLHEREVHRGEVRSAARVRKGARE